MIGRSIRDDIVRTLFAVLLLAGLDGMPAQAAPKVASFYPLGGQRGTTTDVEIRGAGLEGCHTVWLGPGSKPAPARSSSGPPADYRHILGPGGIDAQVQAMPDSARANVRLVLAPDARVGFHGLSLVGPNGLSNTILFWVGPDAVNQESATPHNGPRTAQPVPVPGAVNGRITASGQLPHYVFEVAREQTLAFEVVTLHGAGFDPQLALYETGGSFLDARRSKRLLFREELTQGGMPASRRMTYHFSKAGRYVVNIGTVFAQSSGDFSYLLRISPDRAADMQDALTWARSRLANIHARAVGLTAPEVTRVYETEPNDSAAQARVFQVPAVLEGSIGQPGDIDSFRFHAKAGQKLALEVQTPHATRPHFNLRLDVLNARGEVVLSNLHEQDGKIGTVDARVIQLAPEVVGKLDADGDYILRVRDLTSIHGSPDHVYRVLVRPQVPHIADVRVQPTGSINLRPGANQRLSLQVVGKEEFAGTAAFSVEGLPPGVKAFVGANGSSVQLVAEPTVPATPLPQVVRIWGLAQLGEKSGSTFLVAEIPIMVVK